MIMARTVTSHLFHSVNGVVEHPHFWQFDAFGIETIRSLFLAGLIDTLTLTTHPVVTNEGRRLFDESVPSTRLSLLEAKQTRAGNAILTYALR